MTIHLVFSVIPNDNIIISNVIMEATTDIYNSSLYYYFTLWYSSTLTIYLYMCLCVCAYVIYDNSSFT